MTSFPYASCFNCVILPDKIFGYTWKRFVAIANAGSPEEFPINESVTISPVLCSSFCTSAGILLQMHYLQISSLLHVVGL